jgi:hypothetical protein
MRAVLLAVRLAVLLALLVEIAPAPAGAQAPARAPTSTASSTPNTIRLAADAERPAATLAAVAWLAGGAWQGTGLGGEVEERWSAPAAGAMMGMFRLIRKDAEGRPAVVFYEFLLFLEEKGSLVLRLKHFDAGLIGWEEKDRSVTFRLARVEPDAISFDGLTFKRTGPDAMTVFLALRDKADGPFREERFAFVRR